MNGVAFRGKAKLIIETLSDPFRCRTVTGKLPAPVLVSTSSPLLTLEKRPERWYHYQMYGSTWENTGKHGVLPVPARLNRGQYLKGELKGNFK